MIKVWSDGSCIQGQWKYNESTLLPIPPKNTSGAWAAVIDRYGLEAAHVYGRVRGATNTEMEMRAATEGLRAVVADGSPVVLYVDCMTVGRVHHLWMAGELPSRKKLRDAGRADWGYFIDQCERVFPTVVQVLKDSPGWQKEALLRAHKIARREAKAAFSEPVKEKPRLVLSVPADGRRADRKGAAWVHEKDLPR